MTFETRELSGSLFKNNAKREGKQDPDYEGRCKIGGVEFRISSWINTAKDGSKYMGLKFREVIAQPAEQPPPPVQEEFVPDKDIPFDSVARDHLKNTHCCSDPMLVARGPRVSECLNCCAVVWS